MGVIGGLRTLELTGVFEPIKNWQNFLRKKLKVNIFSDFKLEKIKHYDAITLFE